MIHPPAFVLQRTGIVRASRRAFTLIELLAVITIILILAGLILNIAGSAQYKSSVARASAEIKQMETAMESYKVDNGVYPQGPAVTSTSTPPTKTSTDLIDPQVDIDPASTSNAKYLAACKFLFQQLSGNPQLAVGATVTVPSKAYITFLPGQLTNSDGTAVSSGINSSTYIIDPFGFSYGYSTAGAYAAANGTTAAGYNPTFDLWSTAGYTTPTGTSSTGGKLYPTVPATYSGPLGTTQTAQQAFDATLWAKNW